MLIEMPSTVQEAWGEAVAADFSLWLEGVMTERLVDKNDFSLTLRRLDDVERGVEGVRTEVRELRQDMDVRFDRMQGRFDERFDRQVAQMDERFDQFSARMDERFDRFAAKMDERLDRFAAKMDERLDRFTTHFDERLNRQSAELNGRFDRLQAQLTQQARWSVAVLATFATVVALLIGIGQMRP